MDTPPKGRMTFDKEKSMLLGIAAVIAAISGGAGGVIARFSADPFYGAEGRALERRIAVIETKVERQILPVAEVLIDELKNDVEAVNRRIDNYISEHNKEYPPPWIREQLMDHEARLRMGGL